MDKKREESFLITIAYIKNKTAFLKRQEEQKKKKKKEILIFFSMK